MGTRYRARRVVGDGEGKSARQALLVRFIRLTTPTTAYYPIVDLHPHRVHREDQGRGRDAGGDEAAASRAAAVVSSASAPAPAKVKGRGKQDASFLGTFLMYASRARERARTCLDALHSVLERQDGDVQFQANAAQDALKSYLQYALELLEMEDEGTIRSRDRKAFHWAFPYIGQSKADGEESSRLSAHGLAFEVLSVFVAWGEFCGVASAGFVGPSFSSCLSFPNSPRPGPLARRLLSIPLGLR